MGNCVESRKLLRYFKPFFKSINPIRRLLLEITYYLIMNESLKSL